MTSNATHGSVRNYDRLLIGGEWRTPSSDTKIDVISPTTEQVIARVAAAEREDIDAAVAEARIAFDEGPWPSMTPAERAEYLVRLCTEIESRLEDMAAAFTADVGAPVSISLWGQQLALPVLNDAITVHERFPFEEVREWDAARKVKIVREPIGVVAAVIPWNGPVAGAVNKIAPALVAGCTVILKPAEEGLGSIMILADALVAAGFPPGVISVLPATREIGEYLVTHDGVDKVAFTGSTAAGRRIGALCGELVRPVTLELGGKSAAIIADDLPLEQVLPTLIQSGFGHNGQVCAALTRILVPRERQDELIAALKFASTQFKVGDPSDPTTMFGPVVSERQRDRIEEYIEIGRTEGAEIAVGGQRPDIPRGWFVEPTVFANVDNSMRIAQEEIFGPVLVVIPFDSIDHAVEIANDSKYGLSGAVFAKDNALAEQIARRIRTGQVGVNMWDLCTVQPFGGYKESGLGREGSVEGLSTFLETKVLMMTSD
ncbi:aldehyde dehydrogenase [Mycobacterium sp. 1274756.6]|uniref:aldehyde dehydrogenase n=1 Tax=Mycobacterium sp. 1274756.6 TaxID=1834076 RepID=UPI0007FBA6C2|nr:aldehyde dehydrogenase [Mycobacterium sp. 1274756.6]OBJ67835.1 aldehyde dehydrogenase [Mycobacterium sp. 1274756.6]